MTAKEKTNELLLDQLYRFEGVMGMLNCSLDCEFQTAFHRLIRAEIEKLKKENVTMNEKAKLKSESMWELWLNGTVVTKFKGFPKVDYRDTCVTVWDEDSYTVIPFSARASSLLRRIDR